MDFSAIEFRLLLFLCNHPRLHSRRLLRRRMWLLRSYPYGVRTGRFSCTSPNYSSKGGA